MEAAGAGGGGNEVFLDGNTVSDLQDEKALEITCARE